MHMHYVYAFLPAALIPPALMYLLKITGWAHRIRDKGGMMVTSVGMACALWAVSMLFDPADWWQLQNVELPFWQPVYLALKTMVTLGMSMFITVTTCFLLVWIHRRR
jgi:hypothetical protein